MDETVIYYTQMNKENNCNKFNEIQEINSLKNCDIKNIKTTKYINSCHRSNSGKKESNKICHRYKHTNTNSCSNTDSVKCGHCYYTNNFNRLQIKNPYMYSYVAHAITAAASTAAVAAAETATSTHERLKFVYDNSHASSLAAYDENIFNNTFILATSSSSSLSSSLASSSSAASYISSSSTSVITYGNLNDSTSTVTSSANASTSASSSPATSSAAAAAGSTPSSPLIEVGVNVSLTSSDDWSHFYDLVLSWQGICLIAVFCAFIVITIIGNTLVILAVITTRRLKTVTNCFVMSLAVADLLVGIFVMPPAVAVHLIGSWQLGWVLCDIWISLDVLLCTASILSLCAISVDRYLAVTQPLTYSRKRRSKRLALIMILIVWALALAITCPPILGWKRNYMLKNVYLIVMKFKRYTAADIDNELDPDLSEFDLSSGQKKQQAARTLSNQTLAKDLQEIMASDNEIANTTQCHSLLVLQQQAATSPSEKNGCYEMKRPASLKRTSTASSAITTMTSTTACTGTGASATATVAMGMENPWTFTPTAHQQQHYQQHAHPNKHMRTHSMRHQHYLNAAAANITSTSPGNTLTPDSIVTGSGSSILRPHTPQLRSHHHQHSHHYTTKSLSNRISSLKKETKTTQTLSIVVGGFIACWLPFFINYLITPFLDEDQVSSTLAKVLTWLGWFNSAINPFIYAFYSVDFRAAFWRLTCKRFFSASSKPQFPTNTMSIRR
ncbi:tyramine receptor 1 [Lucilia cuprina]|uniref:tyramine receptor 1 n=1 Tax=Lucilia cuprina TaxID=7375 RepID=UPI001F060141|nr:tyramine receptor 1 [Lucilia cuprina]